ncbi:MAG: HNH/ENDO VII family nuclease [Phascolarctobacterium sp.]|nr:HNH/ENDO VII family nuclease [Phascolarctobacterium sp.]
MGCGLHGGFGNTKGSQPAVKGYKYFKPVNFKGTVKVDGVEVDVSRRVYQRNDIDFNYYDSASGMTNLERMQNGKAPIGSDGNPIQLHHTIQKESGNMAEVKEITHQEYYSTLHGLISNGNSFRNNEKLKRQYNNFRRLYWKWRAQQFLGGSN